MVLIEVTASESVEPGEKINRARKSTDTTHQVPLKIVWSVQQKTDNNTPSRSSRIRQHSMYYSY